MNLDWLSKEDFFKKLRSGKTNLGYFFWNINICINDDRRILCVVSNFAADKKRIWDAVTTRLRELITSGVMNKDGSVSIKIKSGDKLSLGRLTDEEFKISLDEHNKLIKESETNEK